VKKKTELGNVREQSSMIADTNEVRLFQESTTFEGKSMLEVMALRVVLILKVKTN